MNAPLRHPASPYARRLARQRGIVLEGLAGSGPFGRIVAADVEAFVTIAATEQTSAAPPLPIRPAATVAISALGTQVRLQALKDLIAQFAGAKLELSLTTLMLRSIGRSIGELSPDATVAWEVGGGSLRRLVALTGIADAPFGRVQGLIENDSPTAAAFAVPPVSVSILPLLPQGVRPVMLSLLPQFSMRLAISVWEEQADVLLCFDASKVDEMAAATFLSRIREDLETPLRLLA